MEEFLIILKLKGLYLYRPLKIELENKDLYLYPGYHSKEVHQLQNFKKWDRSGKEKWDFEYIDYKVGGFKEKMRFKEDSEFYIITKNEEEEEDKHHDNLEKKINGCKKIRIVNFVQ